MQADATTSHTALIGSPRAMATKPSAPAPRAATSNQNIFLAKFMCPARLCKSCYLPHILCAHCRTVNTPPQPVVSQFDLDGRSRCGKSCLIGPGCFVIAGYEGLDVVLRFASLPEGGGYIFF